MNPFFIEQMAMYSAYHRDARNRATHFIGIPAIVLATTIAGRWPGSLVALIGLANSVLMKSPHNVLVPNSGDQVALIASAVVSLLVVLAGDYYRSLSRRELSDLHELHELSATLASVPTLPEQLKLILVTFARIHGAPRGLIWIHDAAREEAKELLRQRALPGRQAA